MGVYGKEVVIYKKKKRTHYDTIKGAGGAIGSEQDIENGINVSY